MDRIQAAYLAAGLFGAITGTSELLTRYKDAPSRVFMIGSAWIYIALNAAASLLALYIIHVFGVRFGFEESEIEKVFIAQVVVAGFGALLLLRTNLSFKAGDGEVKIGPSKVLEVFLEASDQSIDRIRRKRNHQLISMLMRNISFEKALKSLPGVCFLQKRDVSEDLLIHFSHDLSALAQNVEVSNHFKVLILGTRLSELVGVSILQQAILVLGNEIIDAPTMANSAPSYAQQAGNAGHSVESNTRA